MKKKELTKKEQDELESTINELEESEEYDREERETELMYMVERLCEMSKSDYRKFVRYMRHERIARQHLGSMSQDA